MAIRAGAARRGPNPLAGVLRNLEHRTRTVQRSSSTQGRRLRSDIAEVEASPGPAGPRGKPGLPGRPGPPGPGTVATVVTSDSEGRATWVFPEALKAVPVVVATPVDPNPADNTTVVATLEKVNDTDVTVRVWRTRPLLGLGLLPMVPAGAGVEVHVHAAVPSQ